MEKKFDTEGKSLQDLHWAGLTAISHVTGAKDSDIHQWPFITGGFYDEVLAVAFYYTAHAELPESLGHAVISEAAERGIKNTKQYLKDKMQQILDPKGFAKAQKAREREMVRDFNLRMEKFDRERRRQHAIEKQAEERAEKAKRDSFNSQHAQAPEGSVKELAAKYGKSIGEIRKLKAAGQLHTLTQQEA